jgi:hypothetical protein
MIKEEKGKECWKEKKLKERMKEGNNK